MGNMAFHKGVGYFLRAKDANASANAGAPSLITAGAGLDALKVTGVTIDRATPSGDLSLSAHVVSTFLAALAATKTLSLAHELQESADGAAWDAAEVIEASTVVATSAAGGNERGVSEHNIDLSGRKRYIRFNVTPDLSAAGVDTALFTTTCELGGDITPPV